MGNLMLKLQLLFYPYIVLCTIDGLSYMDPLNFRPLPQKDDPCNPLYWYPREIPAYCYQRQINTSIVTPKAPCNESIPVPEPIPLPLPVQPFVPIIPPPPPPPMPIYPALYPGYAAFPGMAAIPNLGYVYPGLYRTYPGFQSQGPGFLPGLPGLVSRDGGINVMPFSDAYADLLNRHTDSLMLRKYQKYLKRKPWKRLSG